MLIYSKLYEKSFKYLFMIYKWLFLSVFYVTHGGEKLLQLYWMMKFWHVYSKVKIYSLSPSKWMKTDQFLLTVKSSLYSQLNWWTRPQSKGKTFLACGFDAAFLPIDFRVVEKLWAVFNAAKKLFNPTQVALTKIPRNEAKIYPSKRIFLPLKDTY